MAIGATIILTQVFINKVSAIQENSLFLIVADNFRLSWKFVFNVLLNLKPIPLSSTQQTQSQH